MRCTRQFMTVVILGFTLTASAWAGAVVAGFNSTSDGRNDDGTYTAPSGCTNPASGGTCAGTAQNIGFTANFFGVNFTSAFLNTNGNITFDSPLSTFTPFNLTTTGRQIIAPFFADVDTRNTSSGVLQFGTGTFGGRNAFGVTWPGVGYFSSNADKLNTFQVLLVDRSDTGAGNFDIVFNYDNILWETGDASGGTNGLGGSSARVGFSNGSGNPGTSFELTGSAVPGALINGGPDALISHDLNSDVLGRYIFFARNGTVSVGVPEPATFFLLPFGGLALLALKRARRARS